MFKGATCKMDYCGVGGWQVQPKMSVFDEMGNPKPLIFDKHRMRLGILQST